MIGYAGEDACYACATHALLALGLDTDTGLTQRARDCLVRCDRNLSPARSQHDGEFFIGAKLDRGFGAEHLKVVAMELRRKGSQSERADPLI
jgi:hypothetical protein